ncbi:MAG: AAA family ATPase [Verrucomicrobiota bacterium]
MSFSPDTALAHLRHAHRQSRLAHAYLISGPPGSGKSNLARRLSAELNHATPEEIARGQIPDVVLTEPASKSRRIVIEQIRNLERALQMRTAPGRKKVAIIRDADRMQSQAANAFLKTLEEPPPHSLLLLLTTLPEALPDTIVSRCFSVALSASAPKVAAPEEKELAALLGALAADSAPVPRAYRISQGIQRLLGKLRDEIRLQHDDALKVEEKRYRQTTDGAWLDEREGYYKALTESIYRERRGQLLEVLFAWWADVLRTQAGLSAAQLPECRRATAARAAQMTVPDVLSRMERLEAMREQLNTTAQEALVLEAACLSVFGRQTPPI